jgi:hypothetical protein
VSMSSVWREEPDVSVAVATAWGMVGGTAGGRMTGGARPGPRRSCSLRDGFVAPMGKIESGSNDGRGAILPSRPA